MKILLFAICASLVINLNEVKASDDILHDVRLGSGNVSGKFLQCAENEVIKQILTADFLPVLASSIVDLEQSPVPRLAKVSFTVYRNSPREVRKFWLLITSLDDNGWIMEQDSSEIYPYSQTASVNATLLDRPSGIELVKISLANCGK